MSKPIQQDESGAGRSILDDIPPELLSQIFLCYLELSNPTTINRGIQSLCLTCRRFQEIVYNTTEVWSNIDIVIDSRSNDSFLLAVETWLQRSLQHPLRISFTVVGYGPMLKSGSGRLANVVLDILLLRIHRWSSVSFSFSPDPLPPFEPTASAPLLQSIELRDGVYSLPTFTWLVNLIKRAPNLRTFIDVLPPRSAAYLEMVPFSQLSTLKLNQTISPLHALEIIHRMPLLEVCHMSLEYGSGWEVQTTTSVTCYAHDFKIYVRGCSRNFFAPLFAPKLEALEIHFSKEKAKQEEAEHPLQQFLRRTATTLTSLTIRNLFISDDKLLGCLKAASPQLKSFRILVDDLSALDYYDVENVSAAVISALECGSSQTIDEVLCPRLEFLTLHRCFSAEDGLLSQMVASRWNPTVRSHESDRKNPSPVRGVSALLFVDVVLRYHSNVKDCLALGQLYRQGLGGRAKHGYP